MKSESPERPSGKRWAWRSRPLFVAAAIGCGILLALLAGLPIAEVVTRWLVVAEYRSHVARFNQARIGEEFVYKYSGYQADADHPIEYRLQPDHARAIPIVEGAWIQNTNRIQFLAGAWHLTDSDGWHSRGYLRWVCARDGTSEVWSPLYAEDADRLAGVTNLTVRELRAEWRELVWSLSELRAVGEKGDWIFASGLPADGMVTPPMVFRAGAAAVPEKAALWSYRVNEHGFRATGTPATGGKMRILFVGDSCLFGWGVHDHETLTARLEELLNSDSASPGVVCLNAGVPGYCAEQQYHCLVEIFERYQPDAVVVCQVRNDLEPQMVAPERPHRVYRDVFLNSWFLERSKRTFNKVLRHTSSFIAATGVPYDFPVEKLWLNSAKFVGKADSGPGWRRNDNRKAVAREAYAGIRDYCRDRNCPLMIVSLPTINGKEFIPIFNFSANQVRDWATALDVPYLNLMPWVADIPHDELRVSKQDGHMNARGQIILARALVDPVRALLRGELRVTEAARTRANESDPKGLSSD